MVVTCGGGGKERRRRRMSDRSLPRRYPLRNAGRRVTAKVSPTVFFLLFFFFPPRILHPVATAREIFHRYRARSCTYTPDLEPGISRRRKNNGEFSRFFFFSDFFLYGLFSLSFRIFSGLFSPRKPLRFSTLGRRT